MAKIKIVTDINPSAMNAKQVIAQYNFYPHDIYIADLREAFVKGNCDYCVCIWRIKNLKK